MSGAARPLLGVSGANGVSEVLGDSPRVATGLSASDGYVSAGTNNSTHDDGGFIGQECHLPTADSAAVSPSRTFQAIEELVVSVTARGASVHPNTPETPAVNSSRRAVAPVTE